MNLRTLFQKHKTEKDLAVEDLPKIWDEYCKAGYEQLGLTPPSQRMAEALERALVPCPGGTVLDGGCGTGHNFERILRGTQADKLYAVDFSEAMVAKAKEKRDRTSSLKSKIDIMKADLLKPFPFRDETLDAEVFHITIGYLPHKGWKHALKEAYRTIRPGGYLYTTTQLKGFDFSKAVKREILGVLLRNPLLILSLIKVKKPVDKIHHLEEEDIIVYPTEEELLEEQRKLGFANIEVKERLFEGAVVVMRAQKPA